MIIGTYPCCDGHLCLAMPARTPAWRPEDCPHCGARVWHRFSRVESMSWTEADFLAEHVVDAATREIRPRPGTAAAAFDKMQRDPSLLAATDATLDRIRRAAAVEPDPAA